MRVISILVKVNIILGLLVIDMIKTFDKRAMKTQMLNYPVRKQDQDSIQISEDSSPMRLVNIIRYNQII